MSGGQREGGAPWGEVDAPVHVLARPARDHAGNAPLRPPRLGGREGVVVAVCGLDVGVTHHGGHVLDLDARLGRERAPRVPEVLHGYAGQPVAAHPRLDAVGNLRRREVADDAPAGPAERHPDGAAYRAGHTALMEWFPTFSYCGDPQP